MGRNGVSLLEVEKVILELQESGKNPTVDGIREKLGTGSKSTIARHLREWKAGQTPSPGENLSPELMIVVSGLWEKLSTEADKRIIEIEINHDQEMKALSEKLTQSHQDYAALQKQNDYLNESYIAEKNAKEKYEEAFYHEQQEHAKLKERYPIILQQLEEYKIEKANLHQLANNIQANMEHYQQAIQQLRIEQTLEMERQQTQSQQALLGLKQELAFSQEQYQALENKMHHQDGAFKQMAAQYKMLQQEHEKLLIRWEEAIREFNIYEERCNQQQKNLQQQAAVLTEKIDIISQLEKEQVILHDQSERLEKNKQDAEERIAILEQEKLKIMDEKSQLYGHLKQIQAMIHSN